MEIVLESSDYDLSELVAFLRRELISKPLRIANVRIEPRWIQVGGDSVFRIEEFKHVIVADLPPVTDDNDYAMFPRMSLFAEAFEGAGTVFAIPDLGLRWMVP